MNAALSLAGEFPVYLHEGFLARGYGFFKRIESAKPNLLTILLDGGLKFLALLVEAYSRCACRVVLHSRQISTILGARCQSQIAQPIVVPYAVSVVDFFGRPCAVNVDPSQVVSRIAKRQIDRDVDVVAHTGAGFLSSKRAVPVGFAVFPCAPSENACLGIVSQNASYEIGGQNRSSHQTPAWPTAVDLGVKGVTPKTDTFQGE